MADRIGKMYSIDEKRGQILNKVFGGKILVPTEGHIVPFHCGILPTMRSYLLETIQTEENKRFRQQILTHPFWQAIEQGTLPKEKLALFALQDYWLVKQATRIDTLVIASMTDLLLRQLLMERLAKQVLHRKDTLTTFAHAVGVTKKHLASVTPIAGCMALTTFFYWMIDNTDDLEKIVAIDASKEVFSLLCVKVKNSLMTNYHLSESEVDFFTVHDKWEEKLEPVDGYIRKQCKDPKVKEKVNQAIS
ncbi:MAG: hypothetical protein KGL95_07055, partial [Patescibacteria group bacterium]|nr:hypothetical protein [Patescibacteria group bacterium]